MIKEVMLPLAVGLALFLFGMQVMRIGLTNLAGNRLKEGLLRFTQSPVHGLLTGMIATGLVQSSSAVTVLTIGLVNARLITFPQTIGIILGANIGTSLTTELIALNISDFAVPMLILGTIGWLTRHRLTRCIGLSSAGFGCIFLGIKTMQAIVIPLKAAGFFDNLLLASSEPMVGVAAGIIITAIIQSSSATIAMVMGLMEGAVMPLEVGIAMVLGANVGTCVTAWIASIGGLPAAKQVAWAHIILNIVGTLAFLPLIPILAKISLSLTYIPATQIAHAQTIFNIVSSLVALPFVRILAKTAIWLTPNSKLI
jgi:phosphate:Na+ symporter